MLPLVLDSKKGVDRFKRSEIVLSETSRIKTPREQGPMIFRAIGQVTTTCSYGVGSTALHFR